MQIFAVFRVITANFCDSENLIFCHLNYKEIECCILVGFYFLANMNSETDTRYFICHLDLLLLVSFIKVGSC